MFRILAWIALLPAVLSALGCGDPVLTEAWQREDYRAVIVRSENLLREGSDLSQGQIKAELALAYYENDENQKAFYSFLQALEDGSAEQSSAEEPLEGLQLYEEAFALYTEEYGRKAPENADIIVDTYGEIARAHPNYFQLRFLVAIAQANMGRFEEFFTLFYPSFLRHPDHYLVHKTKGVLCLKLIDSAHNEIERGILAGKAIECFEKALERFKGDHTLYRIILVLSPDEHLPRRVPLFVGELLGKDVPIARRDVYLYVRLAVDTGHPEMAEAIIERASSLYEFSRSLNAARAYLEEHHPKDVAQTDQ